MLGGDVTNSGDLLSMTLLKSILDSLNKPYYAVPGNHDKMKGDSIVRHFQSIFGSDKFHFHTKSFHIIGFPTLPDSKRGGVRTQNNELLWLDSILKLSLPNEKILAVTHYPLQKGDVDNYTQIIDVLKKYPLLAVLNGHYHRNMLLNYDEIPGIVNRSTLSVGTQQGGYNIYTLNDSLHVAEKILDTPLREWLALPIEQ
ncbi:MAG: hypothetical protein AUK44_08785 [Porphyromonadaceae bacterium CG2_30_38_12]|nr:MAG: hypothetical protein AUK44_08785 [Porphyromonadaceae bacterium CG2_30_38_12]